MIDAASELEGLIWYYFAYNNYKNDKNHFWEPMETTTNLSLRIITLQ